MLLGRKTGAAQRTAVLWTMPGSTRVCVGTWYGLNHLQGAHLHPLAVNTPRECIP